MKPDMPRTLRLPPGLESRLDEYAAQQGISKSEVIIRSVRKFLAVHAKSGAYQIYLDVMRKSGTMERSEDPAKETRHHKLAVREAFRRKYETRSARAIEVRGKTLASRMVS